VSKKINIVISGSNINSGGPLTIFNYFLLSFNDRGNEFNTTAFVSNKYLFSNYTNISFIELKWYKKFIPLKFFYEYLYYYLYSKKNNIDLWISLSDCNPNVKAKTRVSYFHNAIPSYSFSFIEIWFSTKLFLQKFYSKFFYKINIKQNNFIIVQQSWFREYIHKEFNYNIDNIIVFPPRQFVPKMLSHKKDEVKHVFVCPTKAAYYKNNEILLKAFSQLPINAKNKFIFYITLNGKENRYSKKLYKAYGHLNNVFWIGQISHEKMKTIYNKSNTLLFLSRLESWGLPLTEAASFGLNIVASNLPYAFETVSNYEKVFYVNTNDLQRLSVVIKDFIFNNRVDFAKKKIPIIKTPFVQTFNECIEYIFLNERVR
jgi:glycosyltransferase involved in cell wall biosynthesis